MSGTQSILEINKDSLFAEYEDQLLYYADAKYTQEKFLVGEGIEKDRLNHILNFHRLFNTESCEMVEYINRKIEGEVGCSQERLCDAIQEYKQCHHKEECTDTEVMCEVCDISSIGSAKW